LGSRLRSVVMNHLPCSVESVKEPGWHKDQIEDHPSSALQSLRNQIEINFPPRSEMEHLKMKDQKESQEDPGDPLKKPPIGTPFSGFLVHKSFSFEEVNGLKLKTTNDS